jgi:NADH-quinone oxidoreductase subunit E
MDTAYAESRVARQGAAEVEVSSKVKGIVEATEGHLISCLQEIQDAYNYLPKEALVILSNALGIPLISVYEVATFYKTFSLVPKGKHICTVCQGTACHVRGSARVVDALCGEMGVPPGHTTEDMKFTLETVNCLGCCAIGPVLVLDNAYHGAMTTTKATSLIKHLRRED